MQLLFRPVRAILHTAYGPRLAHGAAPFHFPTDPTAALDLAARLDWKADLHLSEGHPTADRLSHSALALCCRVAGGVA